MAVVKGKNASVEFWTQARAAEFQKRIDERKSVCFHCKGSGYRTTPMETPVPAEDCPGCDGVGTTNRLTTMVDKMMEVGASVQDIHEWFGPLIEPERQIGRVRTGGRVNIELEPGGHVVEGTAFIAAYDRRPGYHDVSSFGGETYYVPGHTSVEFTIRVTDIERYAPPEESPKECEHVWQNRVDPARNVNTYEMIPEMRYQVCTLCDARRPGECLHVWEDNDPVDGRAIRYHECRVCGERNPVHVACTCIVTARERQGLIDCPRHGSPHE